MTEKINDYSFKTRSTKKRFNRFFNYKDEIKITNEYQVSYGCLCFRKRSTVDNFTVLLATRMIWMEPVHF